MTPSWWQRLRKAYDERRAVRWTVEVGLLLVAVALVGAWQTRHHPRGEAPALALQVLDGGPVTLASLQGKPALVAVWAPWCSVCKAESSNLSLARRLVGERGHVVSIATAFEELGQVRAYVQAQGVDYPVWVGGDEVARALQVEAFPTVYVLDARGRIVSSVQGYTTTLGLLWRLLWA